MASIALTPIERDVLLRFDPILDSSLKVDLWRVHEGPEDLHLVELARTIVALLEKGMLHTEDMVEFMLTRNGRTAVFGLLREQQAGGTISSSDIGELRADPASDARKFR